MEEIQTSLGLTPKQFKRAVRVVHHKSIEEYLGQFYAQARYTLRQAMVDKANKGDARLLKWLGIQELGQRLKVDILQKPSDAPASPAEAIPPGFQLIMAGGQQVLVSGNAPKAKQPHEEIPEVEVILRKEAGEEIKPAPVVTPKNRQEIVVSAHSVKK